LLTLARGRAGRLPFGITTPDRFSE
jgi:hypothetical protein